MDSQDTNRHGPFVNDLFKEYIGDGVYVTKEYGQIVLTTENGVEIINKIVLESDVFERLVAWTERLGMRP